MHVEQPERRPIRVVRLEHRVRDVEHRNSRLRPPLRRALVRVAVKHRGHVEARQRILEAARAEKGKDLRRLAFDRVANRRVVHEHDALRDAQPRERGLELERFLHRLVDEVLDDLLAPRAQRAAAEPAAEAADAGEPDAAELPRVAVEHVHADVARGSCRSLSPRPPRSRDCRARATTGMFTCARSFASNARFVGEAVVGEIAAQHEHVGGLGDLREQRLQAACELFE